MNKTVFIALILAVIVGYVYGHAKLNSPLAWNTQPSKTNPCGGGAPANKPAVIWEAGKTYSVEWEVVAGDGNGPVTASIDPAGGVNFNTPITVTGTDPVNVGKYTFTITIPANLKCTGNNGQTCSVQFKSSTAWYACSTFSTSSNFTSPDTCTPPSGLKYCTMVNTNSALLPSGQPSFTSMDTATKEVFTNTLFNPNVFTTPNATGCQEAYKLLLCGLQFKDCRTKKGGCQSTCKTVKQLCGITESHYNLYPCEEYLVDRDVTGACPADNAGFAQTANFALIALTALVALFFAAL